MKGERHMTFGEYQVEQGDFELRLWPISQIELISKLATIAVQSPARSNTDSLVTYDYTIHSGC